MITALWKRAFTLIELLVVIAIIGILIMMSTTGNQFGEAAKKGPA